MIHIENINVFVQPAPNLSTEPDYQSTVDNGLDKIEELFAKTFQSMFQAHKETCNANHHAPNPPPGYDDMDSPHYEGLKQQSNAWGAVCELLTELDPNWHSGPGTGRFKALKAICKLAGSSRG